MYDLSTVFISKLCVHFYMKIPKKWNGKISCEFHVSWQVLSNMASNWLVPQLPANQQPCKKILVNWNGYKLFFYNSGTRYWYCSHYLTPHLQYLIECWAIPNNRFYICAYLRSEIKTSLQVDALWEVLSNTDLYSLWCGKINANILLSDLFTAVSITYQFEFQCVPKHHVV